MKITNIFLTIFLIVFLTGCFKEENIDSKQTPIKINVTRAKSVEFSKQLLLYGTFKARDDVAVSSSLQGMQILSTEVELGEPVTKGQVLAYLENISAKSELEQNKLNLNRLNAELAAQEAILKESISTFNRYKALLKADALSKQDFEAQKAKMDVAKANIKSTKAQIAQINSQIANNQHQLNKTELKAPTNGIITKKSAIAGALVGTEPLFNIAKDEILELEAEADINEIPLLKPGQNVNIHLVNSQISLNGKIRLIYPEFDISTRLSKIRIEILDKQDIIIGSYASATINLPNKTISHALPLSAISFKNQTASVSILDKENKIHKVKVKTGEEQNGIVQIISGINSNDTVVLQASAFVDDGDIVTPNFIDFKE